MNILPFVLWVLLFPVCIDIANYFNVLIRKESGLTPKTDKDLKVLDAIAIILWVGISILLYIKLF